MSTVIKVENLGKRYRLGLKEKRKDTLFSQIGHTLTAPIRNFRQLRSMTKFQQEDESVFWALKDINFEVQQGEVLGIIGHNGAGKSTLLKLLSRITEPTTGSIALKGRVAALLEVGTGFHQDLTGRENIYMNGTILGMTKREIDHKLDEIVDFSGVEKHLDTPVKFYSSGMKVRLGFSVAAHLEPEILIIDEVLAVGDAEFQKKCLGKMENVAGSGRTVLFVSHDMGAIDSLCPKCILLKGGQLSENNDTQIVISKYLKESLDISNTSIFKRKDRKGSQKAKVKQISILNGEDFKSNNNIIAGQKITFDIEVSTLGFDKIDNIHIGLAITDNLGRFVTVLNNRMAMDDFRDVKSPEPHLRCTLDKAPFMYGRYWIQTALVVNGEFCDLLEKAASFFVLEGDYYRSGSINSQKRQGIYIEQKWTIQNEL